MKIGEAFRFFDRDFNNSISFGEFRFVCEQLEMWLSNDELKLLYGYLDKDGDGTIGYHEFCKMSEEYRRDLDPFKHNP